MLHCPEQHVNISRCMYSITKNFGIVTLYTVVMCTIVSIYYVSRCLAVTELDLILNCILLINTLVLANIIRTELHINIFVWFLVAINYMQCACSVLTISYPTTYCSLLNDFFIELDKLWTAKIKVKNIFGKFNCINLKGKCTDMYNIFLLSVTE